MSTEQALHTRSGSQCELCGSPEKLSLYEVPLDSNGNEDDSILTCSTCLAQLEDPATMDVHHWHCLSDSMWSTVPAVQVVIWRLLSQLHSEGWANDLLEMLYLEEATLAWARSTESNGEQSSANHVDSNGTPLAVGDTVTLIKDLKVKGANFTAKRGSVVRGISLVSDNPEHIEGRVSGQQIVILTKYVKKSS